MATITQQVLEQLGSDITQMLKDYRTTIDEAYINVGNNLSVSLKSVFKPSAVSGVIDVDTTISFKTGEVKDKITEAADRAWTRKHSILWRDFRVFAASLRINFPYKKPGIKFIEFTSFKMAA